MLVEASAGTGKTWTIAALYVRLVLGHGGENGYRRPLLPADILVMTFTRAATRELSNRVRERLVEAATRVTALRIYPQRLVTVLNEYLHEMADIVKAQVDAITKSSEFVVQSGVFLLHQHPSRVFEQTLADWVGKEDAFLCQSGYSANVGLLQSIADPQTPVYIDTMAHTSLWEGAHAARAPAGRLRRAGRGHERDDELRGTASCIFAASSYAFIRAASSSLPPGRSDRLHGWSAPQSPSWRNTLRCSPPRRCAHRSAARCQRNRACRNRS